MKKLQRWLARFLIITMVISTAFTSYAEEMETTNQLEMVEEKEEEDKNKASEEKEEENKNKASEEKEEENKDKASEEKEEENKDKASEEKEEENKDKVSEEKEEENKDKASEEKEEENKDKVSEEKEEEDKNKVSEEKEKENKDKVSEEKEEEDKNEILEEKTTEEVICTFDGKSITIGYDEEQAEITPSFYKLFDKHGNYVIELDKNIDFPYEVEFSYEGETKIELFQTKDSTIKIKNHNFYISIPEKEFQQEEIELTDEIIYNLGSQEIKVGYDKEQSEETPSAYKLFDNDGEYTIQLEDNAFFPYEVQFQYGNKIIEKWFETPESTIEIDGHIFRVHSEQNDNTKLSQIGIWIEDDYIAARPEPKVFTNSAILPRSLLPLQEVKVSLDLSDYNRFQLKKVKISAILSGLIPSQPVKNEDKVVWRRLWYNNDYEIAEQEDILDFSGISENSFDLELIVGSALQLDESNTKYIVDVTNGTHLRMVNGVDIYGDIEGVRSELIPLDIKFHKAYEQWNEDVQIFLSKTDILANNFYLGFTLNSAYTNAGTIKVYEGSYNTPEEAEEAASRNPGLDITNKLLNEDMSQEDAGFKITANLDDPFYEGTFTFVLEENGEKSVLGVDFMVFCNNGFSLGNDIYALDSTYHTVHKSMNRVRKNDIVYYTYTLQPNYPVDETYFLRLLYVYGGETSGGAMHVTKAVKGHFNSLEEAENEPDIKTILFPKYRYEPGSGYPADYSGSGQDFTVFAEGEIYKFTVNVVESEPDKPDKPEIIGKPLPNPGSSDTYFRIEGAEELQEQYVLPYKHDTYYDMGYQTVFYLDDVPLSSLKPTFWTREKVHVYSGGSGSAGTLQESGKNVADFSNGPVQYAVAAENGINLKNYWVTFVKKQTGGPKLFVNGINGADGPKREIFLTNVHDNIHDIFIANIGDEPLTDLTATLTNAQNIKLDSYWTVGGENNNTLAAFDSADRGIYDAELANVAKIRILPDGEGEIRGTLTISAAGQEPVIITLTGNAGNPKLTTSDIPEAVRYVPYAAQILHNNKYKWNEVTMNVVSGALPQGVILKPNGELYGVPKETGVFRFEIKMTNSDKRFGNSTASYTLTVNENTNMNVDAATDSGYDITKRVGTRVGDDDVITVFEDQEFIVNGEINEFINLWLNGEKLTGTDYSAEKGSTKITIRSQTFQNKANQNGTNTIAAEFRVNGDENKELKRSAQNFKLDVKGGSNEGTNGSGSSSGGGGGGGSNATVPKQNQISNDTPTPKPVEQEIITKPETVTETINIAMNIENGFMAGHVSPEEIVELINKHQNSSENGPMVLEFILTGITADAMNTKLIIPAPVLKTISDKNNISLKVNAGNLGILTFHPTALRSITSRGGEVIEIHLEKESDSQDVTVKVTIDEILLEEIDGGIRVAIPNMEAGEVIILIKTKDGEEIVKKSILENGFVYALLSGSGTIKVINNSKSFRDVNSSDWFYQAVLFVNSRELFVGINETDFGPQMFMSRAMIATVLHRLEDNKILQGNFVFADVPEEQWYSNGILWCANAGILSGYGDNIFGINDNITMEQFCMLMYHYAHYIGMDTIERGDLQSFSDAEKVSAWADDAVRWAIGSGLIQGDGTYLNPKAEITRAQAAEIIMRFVSILVK